jgi:hypothetical protein
MLDPDKKEEYADAMERFGGSFTRALAMALRCADSWNTRTILMTWEKDIQEQYDHVKRAENPGPYPVE